MAITIQLRRDSEAALSDVVAAQGEMLLAIDTHKAVIGDGSTSFSNLVTANRFFKFEDGDGGRVFGGNDANETIIIKGNATQSVPIFKVVNSSDQSIVEVTDNDTQLVKIDSTNADVGDINLLLKAKASQTGEVIAVTDSGDIKNFTVKEDGQTLIDPNDTTDPSLKVIGSSGSQSNGILRVEDTNNNAVLLVKADGVQSEQTVTVDGGSIITQANGDATSNVTLVGTSNSSAKAITVDDGGTENFSVTAGGKIDSKDMEISATGRTIADASVVRADELIANVIKNVKDVSATASITNSDSSFPVGGIRPWAAGSTGNDNNPDEDITFALLGNAFNSNKDMRNAPTGKYLIFGWGISGGQGDSHNIGAPTIAIIDHNTGDPTPVFTIDTNRSSFGLCIRIT